MRDFKHYKNGRETMALCSDCGYAVKEKTMFKKSYKNTAICLCRKCALNLCTELADYGITKGIEKMKRRMRK